MGERQHHHPRSTQWSSVSSQDPYSVALLTVVLPRPDEAPKPKFGVKLVPNAAVPRSILSSTTRYSVAEPQVLYYIYIYTHIYIYIYTYTHTCLHIHAHRYIYILRYTYKHADIHTHTYIYIYIYIYMYACLRAYTHIHMYGYSRYICV